MQQQQENKNLEEAFQEFIKYCNVKNLAKDTIIFYENCFNSFSKFYPQKTFVRDISIKEIKSLTFDL